MKRTNNTVQKLTPELQAKLDTFKEQAIKNDQRINEDQFNNLVDVYYFITKRVLSKGCSTCVPSAFIIIRNYLALYPAAKPKVLSSNTKKLKAKKPINLSKSKVTKDELTFTNEADTSSEGIEKAIKEIPKDGNKTPKKKAPAKKKTAKKSNAKASPRERRKRK